MKGLLERARKLRERLGLDRESAGEAGHLRRTSCSRSSRTSSRRSSEQPHGGLPRGLQGEGREAGGALPRPRERRRSSWRSCSGSAPSTSCSSAARSEIASDEGAAATAEGKLIAELKRQSEAQLEAKNREIDSIQGRLADIERQRQELQSGMDAKVKAREDELRTAIAAELEAEKLKLQGQGLSDEAIAKRIADLETSKNAESAKQLDTYKQPGGGGARPSRRRASRRCPPSTTPTSQKANEDRQKVLVESRQREEELRAQMAQSTATLESEKAKAEAALRELAAQKEKEEVASSQLVSLYAVARTDIAARSYDKAVQSLKAIGDYVNQGEVSQLPAIAKRRDVDLFVVDVLTTYVQGEQEKTSTDTSSLVALAAQVDRAEEQGGRGRPARARRADRGGRAAATARRSPRCPRRRGRRRTSAAIVRDGEAARAALLREGLAKAESGVRRAAVRRGARRSGGKPWRTCPRAPSGSARRSRASPPRAPRRRRRAPAREQSNLAAPILAKAAASLEAKAYDDALPLYLEIVANYPQASPGRRRPSQGIGASAKALSDRATAEARRPGSRPGPPALRRPRPARDGRGRAMPISRRSSRRPTGSSPRRRRTRRRTLAARPRSPPPRRRGSPRPRRRSPTRRPRAPRAVHRERADAGARRRAEGSQRGAARPQATARVCAAAAAEARAAEAEKALADAQASGASRAAVADLTQQRDDAVKSLADANALLGERDPTIARLERDLAAAMEKANAVSTGAATQDAVAAALAAASPAEKVLVENLQADYAAYQARMAALDAKTLATSVLEQGKALGYRNTFLATASMQKTFPGLGEAIRKYDDWWKAEGRNQVVAIVTDLAAKPTRQERRTYLDSLLKKYSADVAMVALLKKLEPLVGTNSGAKVGIRSAVVMERISKLICSPESTVRENSSCHSPRG